ncbi:MAG: leucine-rich repeat protein [Clostridia bacterium]|nr:leucine-rich repeat protein [Clostridia bacterium]
MKTQPPMWMICLAVLFAIALIVTVVLICSSYFGVESNTPDGDVPKNTGGSDTKQTTATLYLPWESGTKESTTENTTAAKTEEPTPILPDISNGLSYVSYGNGTCKVGDVGTCIDACVVIPEYSPMGDLVIEIGAAAFYECATITAVQIPATVKKIGELAFGACNNLMYISVSDENTAYCDVDGVLYNASRSTLILYPPMRAGREFYLDRRTVRISEMAFYRSEYLETVHYLGTPEEWDAMIIGSKNYALAAASMTFGGSVGK